MLIYRVYRNWSTGAYFYVREDAHAMVCGTRLPYRIKVMVKVR